jgi:uncharacterized damage-inducible protein DinB
VAERLEAQEPIISLSLECKTTVTALCHKIRTGYSCKKHLGNGDTFVNVADYLRRQFIYNGWANGEVLHAILAAAGENKRSLQLMSHILAAERVWLERLKQQPQSVPVWPEPDFAWCQAEAQSLEKLWLEYLATVADLSQTISYKNTKGEAWTSSIADVLAHAVMHSAYHRGQIASHMREKGQTPAYTDFIHAVRQKFVR